MNVYTVTMPQWTHADLPPGEQAAFIAAKMRLQYGGVFPADPPKIHMHTGDLFELMDNGDGRWGARLIKAAGPAGLRVVWNDKEMRTPEVGATFVARHGAEHESSPELSTENIRVECGVVRAEGRLDGHDEELKILKKTIKTLEAEVANLRGEIRGLRGPPLLRDTAEMRYENPHEIRGRTLET